VAALKEEAAHSSRWEVGSDFPLLPLSDRRPDNANRDPWHREGVLTGSGRAAIRLLLEYGVETLQWSRVWIPGYFCPDVIPSLAVRDLQILRYASLPTDSTWLEPAALQDGDVVFVVNFFGTRTLPAALGRLSARVTVIEDHTHDPWSSWAFDSVAHWCIASLRKTLPLADGGVLWSPRGLPLPAQPPLTRAHEHCAAQKAAGMRLKQRYVDGEDVSKDEYRRVLIGAEAEIGQGTPSAISEESRVRLGRIDVDAWREVRQRNYERLVGLLGGLPRLQVLPAEAKTAPLAVTLLADSPAERDEVRAALIQHSVYPAILWSLEGSSAEDSPEMELSRRILTIHCDARYGSADIDRVAQLIWTIAGRPHRNA
jgi:hypothetical protein